MDLSIPVGLNEGIGTYLQIDLYAQCTNWTLQETNDTGSWWSSKGSQANPLPGTAIG